VDHGQSKVSRRAVAVDFQRALEGSLGVIDSFLRR